MSRKPSHTADSLLDAAAELAAAEGAAAVTMSAVAAAAGAPSGSVYYRFPDRPALLAALWLRTLDRFQSGFLEALQLDPPHQAAIQAAHHVTAWSLQNPTDAAVLLTGPEPFGYTQWSDEARAAAADRQHRLDAAIQTLATRLGYRTKSDRERLTLLIIDLPYAAIRRTAHHPNSDLPTTAKAVDQIVRDAMAATR
ncbi:TetR/AcrR family transcriptional regulator [Nocardia concava]|uniref:TetR/AcrR family transcriptional regulator n=1 Tax=Nocardia concava TaxID=257281 RepID=UPI0002E55867|nr:TetR family transcriptional regulator [Nocardia concava]